MSLNGIASMGCTSAIPTWIFRIACSDTFAELPLLCDNTMPSSSSLSLPSSSCCLFVCLLVWFGLVWFGLFFFFVCLFVCLCESFVSFVSFVSLVSLVSLASFVSFVSLVSLVSLAS